jgi:hypothetical protein
MGLPANLLAPFPPLPINFSAKPPSLPLPKILSNPVSPPAVLSPSRLLPISFIPCIAFLVYAAN